MHGRRRSVDRFVLDSAQTSALRARPLSPNQPELVSPGSAKRTGRTRGLPSDADVFKRNALGFGAATDSQENEHLHRDRTLESYVARRRRDIATTPVAILDTPDLRDDFYLNVLDWSAKNMVSLALDTAVYTYGYESRRTTCLVKATDSTAYVTALRSMRDGAVLAVANCAGCITLYDFARERRVSSSVIPEERRIATLAVGSPGDTTLQQSRNVLFAGSHGGAIFAFDARTLGGLRTPVTSLRRHTREVCGLQLSPNGTMLASGGNDNTVCIWDLRNSNEPLHVQTDYTAAVKALAWSPWQHGLLATGAGTQDRRIRFWNASSGECVREIRTQSQVCGLLWSPTTSEIVSAHGFSTNDLAIWQYPTLSPVVSFTAHSSRVLHCAMSPDGTTVATTAANTSLKFWRLYPRWPFLRRPYARAIHLFPTSP